MNKVFIKDLKKGNQFKFNDTVLAAVISFLTKTKGGRH